jgi:hypothetical protein
LSAEPPVPPDLPEPPALSAPPALPEPPAPPELPAVPEPPLLPEPPEPRAPPEAPERPEVPPEPAGFLSAAESIRCGAVGWGEASDPWREGVGDAEAAPPLPLPLLLPLEDGAAPPPWDVEPAPLLGEAPLSWVLELEPPPLPPPEDDPLSRALEPLLPLLLEDELLLAPELELLEDELLSCELELGL